MASEVDGGVRVLTLQEALSLYSVMNTLRAECDAAAAYTIESGDPNTVRTWTPKGFRSISFFRTEEESGPPDQRYKVKRTYAAIDGKRLHSSNITSEINEFVIMIEHDFTETTLTGHPQYEIKGEMKGRV